MIRYQGRTSLRVTDRRRPRAQPRSGGNVAEGMEPFLARPLLLCAALACSGAMPAIGSAQTPPHVQAAAPPPAPAVPPPIASHANPAAPVPTNPPEQIAPPAHLSGAAAAPAGRPDGSAGKSAEQPGAPAK